MGIVPLFFSCFPARCSPVTIVLTRAAIFARGVRADVHRRAARAAPFRSSASSRFHPASRIHAWFASRSVGRLDGSSRGGSGLRPVPSIRPMIRPAASRSVDAVDDPSRGRPAHRRRRNGETGNPATDGRGVSVGRGGGEREGDVLAPASEAGWGDASPAPEGYGWGSLQDLLTRR